MLQRITLGLRTLAIVGLLGFGLLGPVFSHAAPAGAASSISDSKKRACTGAGVTSNCTGASSVNKLFSAIVKIFSAVVGVVAVVMVIFSGFRYVTSGGDQNKVAVAKNTLVYAIIGLFIVALAQIITRYVIGIAK